MIIAQISDTHIALDTPDADRRISDFEATIADINTLNPAPDVIVHSGDIVHNGRADEYACAGKILAKAHSPVYVMAGNKDDRDNLRAEFSHHSYLSTGSEFVDYAIDDYPVRLIALDTLHEQSNKGDFCAERKRRLDDFLTVETEKPTAVFTHHPPFEVQVGPEPLNFVNETTMASLRETLQHFGNVAAVFSGHVHRGTSGHIGSIPAIVMPSIATTLRWDDVPTHMKACPVYYIHTFDPAYGFTTEARIVRDR